MPRWMLPGLALSLVGAAPPDPSVLRPRATVEIQGFHSPCFALSPRGGLLAVSLLRPDSKTGRPSSEITVRDVRTGKVSMVWREQEDYQYGRLAFTADGKRLALLSYSLKGNQWNVATGKAERAVAGRFGDAHPVCLAYRTDGKALGVCADRAVIVWDADSGKELVRRRRTITGQPAAFSPDLRLLASANYQDVDLWEVRTGKLARSLLDHRGSVTGLSFSRDGRLLAVSSLRHTEEEEYITEVSLWDVQRGRRKWCLSVDHFSCRSVALSPDGALVAATGTRGVPGGGQLRLFETATGRQRALVQPREVDWIHAPAFTADGKVLAAVCDEGVRLWNVQGTFGKRDPE